MIAAAQYISFTGSQRYYQFTAFLNRHPLIRRYIGKLRAVRHIRGDESGADDKHRHAELFRTFGKT